MANAVKAQPRGIDWASAEMRDGELTVELRGEAPRGWNKSFAAVLALLDRGGGWGQIKVRKGALVVAHVREGAEDELRHLLESAVMQANSDLGLAERDQRPAAGPRERSASAEDERERAARERDRRSTDTFRGFAGTGTR